MDRPYTILVVEDEPAVRDIAVELLRDAGYGVLAAADGYEAVRTLADNPAIDLLFTDVVMPGLSGFALAQQARLLRPEIKVLFTSGYPDEAARLEAESLRQPIIRKPYRGHELARHVARTLGC
jgi:CheY-like chemotaxis protein